MAIEIINLKKETYGVENILEESKNSLDIVRNAFTNLEYDKLKELLSDSNCPLEVMYAFAYNKEFYISLYMETKEKEYNEGKLKITRVYKDKPFVYFTKKFKIQASTSYYSLMGCISDNVNCPIYLKNDIGNIFTHIAKDKINVIQ